MDTYSSNYLFLPVLSAITLTVTGVSPINVCDIDYSPSKIVEVFVNSPCPYSRYTSSTTNETIIVNKDLDDLLAIESFAHKILDGMTPIEESIQAVINDHFWEML